jgi:hypothetical protein
MSTDLPKWKKDWDLKVEAALGMTRTEAKRMLSRDQITGIFRKLEFGSDPHEKKRMSAIKEMVDTYAIAYTSFQDPFRDEIDQRVWVSFALGLLDWPKSKRPKKLGSSPRERLESMERYKKRKRDVTLADWEAFKWD